jgi:hypothetical protein
VAYYRIYPNKNQAAQIAAQIAGRLKEFKQLTNFEA